MCFYAENKFIAETLVGDEYSAKVTSQRSKMINPITKREIKEVKIDPRGFILIPNWTVTHLGLKGLRKEIYSIIYSFTSGENDWTYCSAQYLAKLTGCSEAGVFKVLKELLDKGLINKQTDEICGAVAKAYYQYNSDKVIDDYKKSSGDYKKSGQLKSINTTKAVLTDNKRIKSNTSGEVYTHTSSNLSTSKNNADDVISEIKIHIEENGLDTSLENAWQCHRFLEYVKDKIVNGEKIYSWQKLLETFIKKNQDRIIPLEPNTLDKIRFLRFWYLKHPHENQEKQKTRLAFLDSREQFMIDGQCSNTTSEDNTEVDEDYLVVL